MSTGLISLRRVRLPPVQALQKMGDRSAKIQALPDRVHTVSQWLAVTIRNYDIAARIVHKHSTGKHQR